MPVNPQKITELCEALYLAKTTFKKRFGYQVTEDKAIKIQLESNTYNDRIRLSSLLYQEDDALIFQYYSSKGFERSTETSWNVSFKNNIVKIEQTITYLDYKAGLDEKKTYTLRIEDNQIIEATQDKLFRKWKEFEYSTNFNLVAQTQDRILNDLMKLIQPTLNKYQYQYSKHLNRFFEQIKADISSPERKQFMRTPKEMVNLILSYSS